MSEQKPLAWIMEARKHIGLAEVAGKAHQPVIVRWLAELKAWWRDDETPWCGVFVAHCCRVAGRDLPKHWYRAKDWLNVGRRLDAPAYGCIVVFERKGGGHVGFVVGQDARGNLLVLGGNQGNRVSVAAFPRSRVAGYVWPDKGYLKLAPARERFVLPLGKAGVSQGEA